MILIFTVALAAAFIFIERFIRQNEEQRQKMRKAGIV